MDDAPVNSTVFVVDDNAEIRELLKDIGRAAGLEVAAFTSPQEFLNSYKAGAAGCLVTDVRMPEMDGLELLKRLKEMGIEMPAVVMTGHADVPLAVEAFRGGAADFVEKPFKQEDMVASIRKALALDEKMRRGRGARETMDRGLAKLTERERGVFELLMTGKSTKAVAQELGISIKTVDFHRGRILAKMEADSLLELARQF
jgi:two-component system, LuxR family, response regulator FixJ